MPATVPLPPPAPPVYRDGARADIVLVGLVILVALAAGSFVARNSDLWLHLAAGRLVAAGSYPFGSDPFAGAGSPRDWANHAWLFDLALYLGFTSLGSGSVVAGKAAAVAATAVFMLRTARAAPLWVAAGCVLVALPAMAPRLLLQPAVASYLLLAACVYCLQAGGRAARVVPVLVGLWVNLDGWFLLGPLVVALFAFGRRLDRAKPDPWPAWLVPATGAACLLSPHHVRALVLPQELSPAVWASELPSDPRLAGVFASPWALAPLGQSGGYNLAAMAFFALLALGLSSFVMNRPAARSWRGPVWLAFAALACWQARLVPFFAVVAGPIAALNFGEALPAGAFARPGRAFVILVGVALAGLGWFGKLTGFYNRDRGVAWAIHTDPTLERAATAVAEWRRSHPAADAAVFATHPDLGHYLTWFAPGERSTIDARLALHTGTAGEYRTLSRAVGLFPGEDGERGPGPFTSRGYAAVIVYDPDARRMGGVLRELAGDRWTIVRVAGGAVLAVPRGSGVRIDPERAAFGPPGELTPANDGPAVSPESETKGTVERATGRRGSWEADAGAVYLRLFEATTDRSPALPLLALRAGRHGAELDAADPAAWLGVARAGIVLDTQTWERDAGETLSPLAFLRHVGVAGALVQAVRLNPDSAAAHEVLAGVYARRGFVDLAHRHAAEALRLATRAGPAPGEPAEAFADRLARAAGLAAETERLVQDGENRLVIRTGGMAGDPLGRARAAAELGLPKKAIDVLLASHPDLYGADGVGFLADLLLQAGLAPEARALLDRDELRRNPAALGLFTLPGKALPGGPAWVYRFPAYDWYELCACVGTGRYPGAAAAIDRIGLHLLREEQEYLPPVTAALAVQVGRTAGTGATLSGVGGLPLFHHAAREDFRISAFLTQVRFLSVARADLAVLSAVFELERGDAAGAAGRFRAALPLYAAARGLAPSLPGEALAKRYLDQIERHR